MRKFKIVSTVMLIVAVALYALSIFIPAVSEATLDATWLGLIEVNAIIMAAAVVGAFLKGTSSDSARKVGNGLLVVGFLVGLTCAVSLLAVEADEPSLGAIFMLVATVVLVLHYAFLLVAKLLGKNASDDPNEDVRIVRIKEWKQLKEEGLITEEEFEEKRIAILGLKKK